MLKAEAASKIDAVDVGEVKIDLTHGNLNGQTFNMLTMSAKYALVVSETGVRVGAGNCASWSEATQQRVRDLIASMENDICRSVIGAPPSTGSGAVVDDPNSDGVPQL